MRFSDLDDVICDLNNAADTSTTESNPTQESNPIDTIDTIQAQEKQTFFLSTTEWHTN